MTIKCRPAVYVKDIKLCCCALILLLFVLVPRPWSLVLGPWSLVPVPGSGVGPVPSLCPLPNCAHFAVVDAKNVFTMAYIMGRLLVCFPAFLTGRGRTGRAAGRECVFQSRFSLIPEICTFIYIYSIYMYISLAHIKIDISSSFLLSWLPPPCPSVPKIAGATERVCVCVRECT